jgi:hypothetical protein
MSENQLSDLADKVNGLDFIRTQLRNNIDGFRLEARRNRRRALFIRMAAVILGALTTLLLGLKSSPLFVQYEAQLSAIALGLSATVPILTAWDTFFDSRWLWIRFTAAHTALHSILDDLNYAARNGSVPEGTLDKFYDRLRGVVDQASDAWLDKKTKSIEEGQKVTSG